MPLKGKGFFIWKVPACEGGDAGAIASVAYEAGLSHVLIKIADGTKPYNFDREHKIDLVFPVSEALRSKGIQVWGWHYVYGDDPVGEAAIAIQRVQELNLEGYVIDAEAEYEGPDRPEAAKRFINDVKGSVQVPIGLSSFRFPSYHPSFPWTEFLEECDLNMPQVYWHGAHNAGAQLNRCWQEFQAMPHVLPMVPTGPAYKARTWAPTDDDVSEFLNTASGLPIAAVNFYSWDDCRVNKKNLWSLISEYPWQNSPQLKDIIDRYFEALNKRDIDQIIELYNPAGVHITGERTIQGQEPLRLWYSNFLDQVLPDAKFKLTGVLGSASTRQFSWSAKSKACSVKEGRDTFGLLGGKIMYHYTFFTLSRPDEG